MLSIFVASAQECPRSQPTMVRYESVRCDTLGMLAMFGYGMILYFMYVELEPATPLIQPSNERPQLRSIGVELYNGNSMKSRTMRNKSGLNPRTVWCRRRQAISGPPTVDDTHVSGIEMIELKRMLNSDLRQHCLGGGERSML